MEDFLDALLVAIPEEGLILFPAIDEEDIIIPQVPEEEIIFPQDARLIQLRSLGLPVERVFEPVLQSPDEYLMPTYPPCEELPPNWEQFSGNNYLGVQQHLQEELEAPEEVEDMDNEENDLNDHKETRDCTKPSSQDVDAMSSASQPVAKRVDLSTDDLMLKDIGSSSSSVSSFGLQESAMPDASPPAFGSIREPVPTSEVQTQNIWPSGWVGCVKTLGWPSYYIEDCAVVDAWLHELVQAEESLVNEARRLSVVFDFVDSK